MLLIPEKIQIGTINVVKIIKNIEIPSTPNWKWMNPSIQFFFSINWKSDVFLSKENQRNNDNKKFVIEVKIATYLEFFSTFLAVPLIIKIKKAPTKGINIIADKIGKFI